MSERCGMRFWLRRCEVADRGLRDHAYEPDPPIRTPRIFATASADRTGVTIGSARALPGAEDLVQHPSLYIPELPPATAVTISTYAGTAADVITSGNPEVVSTDNAWTSVANLVWGPLDPGLRVALLVVPLDAPSFADAIRRYPVLPVRAGLAPLRTEKATTCRLSFVVCWWTETYPTSVHWSKLLPTTTVMSAVRSSAASSKVGQVIRVTTTPRPDPAARCGVHP